VSTDKKSPSIYLYFDKAPSDAIFWPQVLNERVIFTFAIGFINDQDSTQVHFELYIFDFIFPHVRKSVCESFEKNIDRRPSYICPQFISLVFII
jgi:hypothetical protein